MKAVIEMLRYEYDWDGELWPGISIMKCRRLGKPQDGKCQPLLVTLDSREQAEFYIKNAKQLRNSTKPEIRQSVFINPDLTPSESRAAYELRLRRRERMQQSRSDQDRQSSKATIPISRTFYHSRDSERVINTKESTAPCNSVLSSTDNQLLMAVSPGHVGLPTGVQMSPLSPLLVSNVSRDRHSLSSSLNEPRLVWRPPSSNDERPASIDAVLIAPPATPIHNANDSATPLMNAAANNTDTPGAGRQC